MKRRINPVIVGAFVLVGLLLGLAALLSFGAGRWFDDPYRFVVFIHDGSVSGLDVGSPVKLSGVRIGRVESVSARYDRASEKIVVRVAADFDQGAAHSLLGGGEQTAEQLMRELIIDGLHAKLNLSGITGLLYMDLMMQEPEPAAAAEVEYEMATGFPIVPMAPSLLAEFTDAFSSIANGLASVDYVGISADLQAVLGQLKQALAGVELKGTIGRIEGAAGAIETLAANPELRTALATLSESMGELRVLLAGWREAMPALRDDAAAALDAAATALAEMEQTAHTATALMEARQEIPDELAASLTSLQRAADAIERLADFLERNPGALLRGRTSAPGRQP